MRHRELKLDSIQQLNSKTLIEVKAAGYKSVPDKFIRSDNKTPEQLAQRFELEIGIITSKGTTSKEERSYICNNLFYKHKVKTEEIIFCEFHFYNNKTIIIYYYIDETKYSFYK